MLFNSTDYLALLLISCLAYWLTPAVRVRQAILLVASVVFYMSWSRPFAVMLLALIFVNWLIGWQLDRSRKRAWLLLGCAINLSLLAGFKYANFFLENLFAMAGSQTSPHLSIILPLGISFYVFELISYLADIHRGQARHERNPVAFALFVLFFPHLIAGPICRAGQFIPQVKQRQVFSFEHTHNGLYLFLCGFALKSGIADGLAPFVTVIFNAPGSYSGFDNLMAALGFGVQILCDFWGYSLMALGSALLFGLILPANFNAPYSAISIRDFWRRWHITLSNWLRDYLYIAMGGSRVDKNWKVQRNLVLTMLLGGLWHGASWNFVIWGGIHGLALAVSRGFEQAQWPARAKRFFSNPIVGWALTMAVVFIAWVFFRARTFDDAIMMLTRIFTPDSLWARSRIGAVFFELMLLYLPLGWWVHRTTFQTSMAAAPLTRQMAAAAVLAAFSLVYYVDGNDFIYFQF